MVQTTWWFKKIVPITADKIKSYISFDGTEISMWWTSWASAERARKILLHTVTNKILCLRYYRLLTTEEKEWKKNNCVHHPPSFNTNMHWGRGVPLNPNAVQSCILCARTNTGVAEASLSRNKSNQNAFPSENQP